MTGFDGVLLLQSACGVRYSAHLNTSEYTTLRANVITRVKNALAQAFAIPSFAVAVA